MLQILVTDDSKLARKRIIQTIESFKLPYQIIAQASDGEEALLLFNKIKPNLIITDIEMPKMNGIKLVKEIREIEKNINIIVVSSIANSQIQQSLKSDASLFFIKKPISIELLKMTLLRVERRLMDAT